jgi:hypothetical protein
MRKPAVEDSLEVPGILASSHGGLGFRVSGSGFQVSGFRFRV